ncbi:hypothetical protein DFH09DRAFT_1277498 [Mycena vulgaris]|nr:hypothetical protein DFH09DRAFT_1277498 [Mycena vulgaris]
MPSQPAIRDIFAVFARVFPPNHKINGDLCPISIQVFQDLPMQYPLFFLARCILASSFPTGLKIQLQTAQTVYEHPAALWSPEFWQKIAVSVFLVLVGGVFAGRRLTLGLMGLDELHLRVLAASSSDPNEQRNARKVLALMDKGRHWVLVVLLLGNVIINESLPIFLDSAIDGGLSAIALSTTSIVKLTSLIPAPSHSEIIPQALSVRYGLSIGAACAPFVLVLMYLLSPIAYPIAKLLDFTLGAEGAHTYKKAELKSFLQLHRTGEEPLREDEIGILSAVLELNAKHVAQIMTPMKDVVTLSADAVLDDKLMETILTSGYSRFPVHEPEDPEAFIGLLLIKKLLKYDPTWALPVSSFPLSILPEAHPSINCFQALDYFQTGRAHLLLISSTPGKPGGAIGVLTLEDIIEEILSEEIVDETDLYEDNVTKQCARRLTTASVMLGIVERRSHRGVSASGDRTPLLRTPSFRGASATGERTPLLRTPSLRSVSWSVYGAAG